MDTIIVAHRGGNFAPENTLENFIGASKAGYQYVETDISRTIDGYWVLHHDKTVDRMTNGSGLIGEMTLEEIKSLSIIEKDKNNSIDKWKIPTLEEFLTVCQEHKIIPFIELKKDPDITDEQISNLLDIIRDSGLLYQGKILSFSGVLLNRIHQVDPEISLILNTKKIDETHIVKAKELNAIMSNDLATITKDGVEYVISSGVPMAVWTVNDREIAKEMQELGISYIYSDVLREIKE